MNYLLHIENASSLTNIIRLPSPPSFDYIDNKYYFTPEFAAGNMSVIVSRDYSIVMLMNLFKIFVLYLSVLNRVLLLLRFCYLSLIVNCE